MRTLLYSFRLLPLAAVALITALALPTSAIARELKVHGSLEAVETQIVTSPTMQVSLEGVGNASHVGRFWLDVESVVSLATFYGEGEFEIHTPSGAKLVGTYAGQGYPTPELVPVDATLTITGGTGRFEGATGTLAYLRVVERPSGVSAGTVNGTIILPEP